MTSPLDPYRCATCGEWQPVRVLAAEHCSLERIARLQCLASQADPINSRPVR